MKIFITGGSGKVGEAITKLLSKETEYELLLHTTNEPTLITYNNQSKIYKFDITDKKILREIILDEKPSFIINASAYTNVDGCEENKKEAWDLNVKVIETLGKAANKLSSKLIHFSTDFIFDGEKGPYSEYDIPNPLSYYGKSKLAGENFILGNVNDYAIVRTNVVYGFSSYGKSDFIRWVIDNLMQDKEFKLINGQFCNPTFSDDIAYGTLRIIEKNSRGIFNFAGNDYLNRYEIGVKIAEVLKLNKSKIIEVPSDSFIQKAKRPEKGGLINLKAETELGIKFADLEAGILALKLQLKI